MVALEVKAMAFAEENGLKDVRFYKRWHKFDIYIATRISDHKRPVFFLLDHEGIRLATESETERFLQGHNVESDMP